MTEINRFYSLNPIGNSWAFEKESECEDFLWFNLNKLFGIQPFKKQFYVKGQFCDILGVNNQKQLTILELKVTEDRYIVQQLTRYYHALIEQKPYPEEIDYDQKINLIALAPSFHQDSFTDDKYNLLHIQFIIFGLEERNGKIYFNLKENGSIRQYPKIEVPSNDNAQARILADLPTKLKQILVKATDLEKQSVIAIRRKLLGFHHKISENMTSGSVIYQLNKASPIAEIRFDDKRNAIALFLWLPLSKSQSRGPGSRRSFLRMRIWTDWKTVLFLGHISRGNGVMITGEEFKTFPSNIIPASLHPFKKSGDSSFQFYKNFHLLPRLKYTETSFDNDADFQEKYVNAVIKYFASVRKNIYHQKSGDPLALTAQEYIQLIINRGKYPQLFLSKVMNLKKPDFSLNAFINLALEERLLKAKKQ